MDATQLFQYLVGLVGSIILVIAITNLLTGKENLKEEN